MFNILPWIPDVYIQLSSAIRYLLSQSEHVAVWFKICSESGRPAFCILWTVMLELFFNCRNSIGSLPKRIFLKILAEVVLKRFYVWKIPSVYKNCQFLFTLVYEVKILIALRNGCESKQNETSTAVKSTHNTTTHLVQIFQACGRLSQLGWEGVAYSFRFF